MTTTINDNRNAPAGGVPFLLEQTPEHRRAYQILRRRVLEQERLAALACVEAYRLWIDEHEAVAL